MSHARTLPLAIALMLALAFAAAAQEGAPVEPPRAETPTVAAAASAERVRFSAPNAVVQMRLEVYTEAGQKVLDTEQRGGSVLDWHLQGGAGERVAEGAYLCVLTFKSLSGRLSQKLGTVIVGPQSAAVQQITAAQLSAAQAQVVGPVEADVALAVLPAGTSEPATVLAHDGSDGQITRTRGALSFRVGDFFSGRDKEQMRLSEEGNLGVGVKQPRARLDVAGDLHASGAISADGGIRFSDGTALTSTGRAARRGKDGSLAPLASGTGTQNQLAKWTDNAGTLGDSVLTEVGGRIGVGTTTPAFKLDLVDNNAGAGGFQLANNTAGAFAQLQNRLVNDAGSLAYYGITSSTYTQAPILSNRAFFGSFKADTVIWTQTAHDILFATNGLGANAERMRITAAGNVGIGNPNPQAKLDVAGDINTSTQYGVGGQRVLSVQGVNNLFAGLGAGEFNTTGQSNAFFGAFTGFNNTTGLGNAFFGASAGQSNTTGQSNAFFGRDAGVRNTTGFSNAFFGASAGVSNTTGNSNAFFGTLVGFHNTTGNNNIFIGDQSGSSNSVENNNTFIGATSDGVAGITNATAVGFKAQVTQSNSLVLGSINGVNGATVDTKVGIGITAPAAALHVAANSGQILLGSAGCVSGFAGIGFASTMTGCSNYSLLGNGNDTIINSPTGGTISFRQSNSFLMAILPNGNVGIGATSPGAKLQVGGGNVAITTQGNGLILRATDGASCYRVTVNNAGTLSTTAVTCP